MMWFDSDAYWASYQAGFRAGEAYADYALNVDGITPSPDDVDDVSVPPMHMTAWESSDGWVMGFGDGIEDFLLSDAMDYGVTA